MSMTLRLWEEKDIPQIVNIEARVFPDPWSRTDLENVLKYSFYRGFLVEEGGQVCGYGCMMVVCDTAEIANIAVDLPYRGRGIAKAILEQMHEFARELGASESLLEVRMSNAPAIRLYMQSGYESYGVRKKYYGNEDALLMRKNLLRGSY